MMPVPEVPRLPDPLRSFAVLIGTSYYGSAELADLPAVDNNLDALAGSTNPPSLRRTYRNNIALCS
jgi:hypothetical protein